MVRLKSLAFSALILLATALACSPLGGGGATEEDAAGISAISPEQQATGTAGAATAVYIASLPDFDPNAPTPTPIPPPGADVSDADEYVSMLLSDLAGPSRDYAQLEAYMGNPFTIVYIGQEPAGVEPTEAATILSSEVLTPANALSEIPDADLEAILGQPPGEFFGSGEAFILTSGWGPEGNDEGILIIREREDVFIWDGVLLSEGGFEQQ